MGSALTLSVAMCTYNGGRYVGEQLESIAEQTRRPDELVVCDDGSTDDTAGIVRAFARRAPFPVRLRVNETNLGSTKNFERAIGLCEGELIALSDQDDVWLPDKLRRLEEAFADGRVGLAFTDGELVDERLRPLGRGVWELVGFGKSEQRLFEGGKAFGVLLDHSLVTGAAMAFRSSLRDLVLPIPPDLVHDGWKVIHDGWIALIVSAVADLAYIPAPLFKYRQHERQQIGVRPAPAAAGSPSALGAAPALREAARRRNSFAAEIHYLRTITARLSTRPELLRDERALGRLRAKLLHLEGRAALPESKLDRLPFVIRELLTLRYRAYSNGARSAAKDLLL